MNQRLHLNLTLSVWKKSVGYNGPFHGAIVRFMQKYLSIKGKGRVAREREIKEMALEDVRDTKQRCFVQETQERKYSKRYTSSYCYFT